MPLCIVLAGMPGSGKTFLRNRLIGAKKEEFAVASSDDHLEMIAARDGKTYSQAFDGHAAEAEDHCTSAIDRAFEEKKNLIVDQTNTGEIKRANLAGLAKLHGYRVECAVIVHPKQGDGLRAEWERRIAANAEKGKDIPKEVLDSMETNFTMPSWEEGFDAMYAFDINGNFLHALDK